MPGRSAAQARNHFLAPLKRALSCVTDAQLATTSGLSPDEIQALTLPQGPVRLKSKQYGHLWLQIAQQFRLVQDGPRSWHTSTVAYDYRLDDSDGELISWHWHPATGVEFPHLHVSRWLIDRKAHTPTGRVSIEAVLRMLLDEYGVPARKDHADDYLDVLKASEKDFITYRRWNG